MSHHSLALCALCIVLFGSPTTPLSATGALEWEPEHEELFVRCLRRWHLQVVVFDRDASGNERTVGTATLRPLSEMVCDEEKRVDVPLSTGGKVRALVRRSLAARRQWARSSMYANMLRRFMRLLRVLDARARALSSTRVVARDRLEARMRRLRAKVALLAAKVARERAALRFRGTGKRALTRAMKRAYMRTQRIVQRAAGACSYSAWSSWSQCSARGTQQAIKKRRGGEVLCAPVVAKSRAC